MENKKTAQVVVIGGGVAGCSTAYHLCKHGFTDVVLLERKKIGSGTSYHAAGMIRDLLGSESNTWMSSYTNKFYAGLAEETGVETGYRKVGSLFVTNNAERMNEFKTTYSMGNAFDLEGHLLSANEVDKHWPLLNTEDLLGGLYMPNDALVNPYQTNLALAEGARQLGAEILEDTVAIELVKKNGSMVGVQTEVGFIECKNVVICGGVWSRDFSKTIDATIPLHACEHYYVLSEEIEGVDEFKLPAVRDFDARCYVRPSAGTYWDEGGKRLMCGFFESVAKPWGMNGIADDFEFGRLEENWQHLHEVLENVKHRIPALKNATMEMLFNGPESFTYDNTYLVGVVPNIKGLFSGTGLCSRGIQASGGLGELLAQIVKHGHNTVGLDLSDVDIARASPFTGNKKYLYDRSVESLGLLFDLHYPHLQVESARPVKTSPFYSRLEQMGACYGETAGWERANFYVKEGQAAEYNYSFDRQNWHDNAAQEHQAVRENIGIFDQTSFAKFLLQGEDALKVLNRICGAEIDVKIGRVVYTQALNTRGGIEADWTITRIADDEFMIVSGVVSQNRDFYFIKNNLNGDNACVSDITSSYAVIGIMGPNSRKMLEAFSSNEDFSHKSFPFFSSKIIDFGYAKARASRLSYVGELGWEIYIPTEFALSCFDQLMNLMSKFGAKMAGYHAMNTLRLEKGYRHWGHDISGVDSPIEAGLGFAVNFNKESFNGKGCLLKQKEQGCSRRLVNFKLDDPKPLLNHFEPIYLKTNEGWKRVGRTTSGMFCYTLGCSAGMGYINSQDGLSLRDEQILNGEYEIEIMSKRYSAKASLEPFYDPRNESMRK